jgi:hypothetical protein
MDLKDAISLGLGIWGAGLSTFLAIKSLQEERVRLNVTCGLGMLTGVLDDRFKIVMTISNSGARDVDVNSAGLLLPQNGRAYSVDSSPRLPCRLQAGSQISAWLDAAGLTEALRERGHSGTIKVRPFASDGTGDEHVGPS